MDDSPTSEPVEVEVFIEINGKVVDDTVEVPRDEWQSMSPNQRHALCQAFVEEHIANTAPAGYRVLGTNAGSELD